jgi:hypothetical protein
MVVATAHNPRNRKAPSLLTVFSKAAESLNEQSLPYNQNSAVRAVLNQRQTRAGFDILDRFRNFPGNRCSITPQSSQSVKSLTTRQKC